MKTTVRTFFVSLAVSSALLFAGCASGPPRTAAPASTPAVDPRLLETIPLDPLVTKGTLDNGLTYILRANTKPEKRAEVWLVVNAGSILEDPDQLGLAHFVEHMAFNGTRRFPRHKLVEYLESIGMRMGPDLNATTGFDETIYMLRVPTDRDDVIDQTLEIVADWIGGGVSFEPAEVDKERGVIVEEWRLGRGVEARVLEKQYPALLHDSRYRARLPIGTKEVLESFRQDALTRFYRDWYRPDLAAVIAVGDFDVAALKTKIEQKLGAIPRAENPRPRPYFPVPGHTETLFSIATDPEVEVNSVGVYYKHPRKREDRFVDYRQYLIENVYDQLVNARLDEIEQRPDAPFLQASAASDTLVRTSSLYFQSAVVQSGDIQRGLDALLTEAERIDRHGFTAGELERVRKDMLASYDNLFQERDKSDSRSFASEFSRHFLDGEPVPGIDLEAKLAREFLPTITLAEVNHLAREWITSENRVLLIAAPSGDSASIPREKKLLAAFKKAAKANIAPYVDRVLDEPLLAELPAPGKVDAVSTIPELGVTEWTLSNGARVILKPTDFKNDEVLFSAFSPGGTSIVDDRDFNSAIFATALLSESGLGRFGTIELGKALAGTRAGASPYLSELEEGLEGQSSASDVETLLQLAHLWFTAPRADEKAARGFLGKLATFIQNRQTSPETVFQDRMMEATSQDHPRRHPLTPEVLDEVSLSTALRVFRDRFADGSDFTFFFVGSFNPEALRPLVETYLASLPAERRAESWRDIGVKAPTGKVEVRVAKGFEPKSLVDLVYTTDSPWSREANHEIATLAQVLELRLREVLREDRGGTYDVSVSAGISPRPSESSTFSISFGCAPESAETLVAAVFAEITAAREKGLDPGYLDKIKEAQRRNLELAVRENRYWISELERAYKLGLDPRTLLERARLIELPTPESLRDAASRYLLPDRYVLGVLSPEVGVGSGSP